MLGFYIIAILAILVMVSSSVDHAVITTKSLEQTPRWHMIERLKLAAFVIYPLSPIFLDMWLDEVFNVDLFGNYMVSCYISLALMVVNVWIAFCKIKPGQIFAMNYFKYIKPIMAVVYVWMAFMIFSINVGSIFTSFAALLREESMWLYVTIVVLVAVLYNTVIFKKIFNNRRFANWEIASLSSLVNLYVVLLLALLNIYIGGAALILFFVRLKSVDTLLITSRCPHCAEVGLVEITDIKKGRVVRECDTSRDRTRTTEDESSSGRTDVDTLKRTMTTRWFQTYDYSYICYGCDAEWMRNIKGEMIAKEVRTTTDTTKEKIKYLK